MTVLFDYIESLLGQVEPVPDAHVKEVVDAQHELGELGASHRGGLLRSHL